MLNVRRAAQALAVALAMVAALPLAAAEIKSENIVRIVNEYRALHDLPPVAEEKRLSLAADDRMREMEEIGYWGHKSPVGTDAFSYMQARGYRYANAGENLAKGFETAEVLVESWMESPGHRANILFPLYDSVGISIIEGATTGKSTGKSVVLLFGRELPVSATSSP